MYARCGRLRLVQDVDPEYPAAELNPVELLHETATTLNPKPQTLNLRGQPRYNLRSFCGPAATHPATDFFRAVSPLLSQRTCQVRV